jgi:quercetin dioxygenase-like cupin family protein
MANFYDKWLGYWDKSTQEKQQARTVIHEEELEWVETPQDHRIALLAAPENGFRTWGSEAMVAEIPVSSHTGKHAHGEEGIYIVEGEGCSIVNGVRYDWKKGSVVWVPFGAEHQHFNTGDETVRYASFTCLNLEQFAGLGRLDQVEVKGFTDSPIEAPVAQGGLDSRGRRLVLHMEDAPVMNYGSEGAPPQSFDEEDEDLAHPIDIDAPPDSANNPMSSGHRDYLRNYMDRDHKAGFQNIELELSNVMGDLPGNHGGKHGHMEAMLYMLDGEGYHCRRQEDSLEEGQPAARPGSTDPAPALQHR